MIGSYDIKWSPTLREGHRLRVFEKRVLRRIFGPKRDEVTGDGRILHNEELHNLYSLPDINNDQVKEDEMGKVCNSTQGERGIHVRTWARKREEDTRKTQT
jgi:hypothetical protein